MNRILVMDNGDYHTEYILRPHFRRKGLDVDIVLATSFLQAIDEFRGGSDIRLVITEMLDVHTEIPCEEYLRTLRAGKNGHYIPLLALTNLDEHPGCLNERVRQLAKNIPLDMVLAKSIQTHRQLPTKVEYLLKYPEAYRHQEAHIIGPPQKPVTFNLSQGEFRGSIGRGRYMPKYRLQEILRK